MATPAAACEFHGGAFWTPSHSWQDFTPRENFVDPIFADLEEELFQTRMEAPKEKVRPSFANAAGEASRKAKFRVRVESAKNTTEMKETDEDTVLTEAGRFTSSIQVTPANR